MEFQTALGMATLAVFSFAVFAFGYALVDLLLRFRSRFDSVPVSSRVRRSLQVASGSLSVGIGLEFVNAHYDVPAELIPIAHTLLILGLMLLVSGLWDALCDRILSRAPGLDKNAQNLLIPVLRKLIQFVIVSVGLVISLGVFGVNFVGIVTGLGIGGIVVALAAKDSIENIFGSITMLFDMPFALGDWVKIAGVEGVVEEINLRSTKIRTFEDSVITLPNSNLIKASVENFGARRFRRQRFFVRVSYASNSASIDRYCEAMREYLEGIDEVDTTRTYVEMNDFAEGSAGILVQAFFVVDSYAREVRLRHDLMLELMHQASIHSVQLIGAPVIEQPALPTAPVVTQANAD
ncbi:MAG: mechanosensitive ion channel family protein [Fimbriimonas sp.]